MDKPSGSVKHNKKTRKPLPKLKIRVPPELKLKNYMEDQQAKSKVITNPSSGITNHPHTVSEHLKEKQSVIVINNQLIQSAQAAIAAALDNTTSFEHSLSDFISKDKSVMSNQSASARCSHMEQPSSTSQTGKQVLSLMDIDAVLGDFDSAGHLQFQSLKGNTLFSAKTFANTREQGLPESMDQISTPHGQHKHSLPGLCMQDVGARQSEEADINTSTELFQILTTPTKIPRRSNTSNQLSHAKSQLLPSTSATHQYPRIQETNRSSTEVTHNHQRQCSQDLINNSSTKLFPPSIRKISPSAAENPVEKRICLQNITRNTITRQDSSRSTAPFHIFDDSVVELVAPRLAQRHQEETARQSISNAGSIFRGNALDLSFSRQGMTASVARNPSYLAQHSSSLVTPSDNQHYLLMQKHYSEQTAQLSHQIEHPNIGHSTDRHAQLPGTMNNEFTLQSTPNPFSQNNQLLLQHNQYGLLNVDNIQDVLRHEIPRGLIGTHTNSATITQNFESIIQFPAQNSLIQSHYDFENRQRMQDPPPYQDHSGHSLKSIAGLQLAPPKSPSQLLWNAQQDHSFQDTHGNLVNEVEPTTINTEVQTDPLPDRLDETPSTFLPGLGVVYKSPRTKKLVVDRETEMDPVMDADHCDDEAAKSSDKSVPQAADSGCHGQTDEHFVEEQGSPYQETDSESEISAHDVVLDRDECLDHSRDDAVKEIRQTSSQTPQTQQKNETEENELFNMFGTVIARIGDSVRKKRDVLTHLQDSVVKCAEVYDAILEKVEKFHEINQLLIGEMSKGSKENIAENNSEQNSSISSEPKPNNSQRNTLVLPPEFDQNNPEWTRKYQKKGPGLVELIPRTNIYVNKKELKNCKRKSKDCRTLAKMLLTEVFSRNALSVCSLTGCKAKAYTSWNLDIRPGLDEHARMVLLTFVETYGAKRGWRTDDTQAIISTIRSKILQIRTEYGQTGRS